MNITTTFDSTKESLQDILRDVREGKIEPHEAPGRGVLIGKEPSGAVRLDVHGRRTHLEKISPDEAILVGPVGPSDGLIHSPSLS